MAVDKQGKSVAGMPAGDERNDQIKANADALAARAEKEFENQGSIDPKKFEIDPEVAQHLGANSRDPREWGRGAIKNMVKGMGYLWVRDHPDQIAEAENRFADTLPRNECVYEGIEWAGFEIVQGDMPEAGNRRDERGYRRISDTILCRAPQILIDKWQRAMDIKTKAKELAVGEGLMAQAEQLARRHNVDPSYVIALAGNMEPGELRRMGRQNLREIAQKDKIIADLRAGTVPAMEIARR